jgi:DUF4097 and DUF4098 domain-containing protein YvlB
MKKTIGQLVILAFLSALSTSGFAQQTTGTQKAPEPDRAVVPLSNPAKPAVINVSVTRGSITVKGYEGKDVIAEARVREKALSENRLLNEYFTEAQKEALDTLAREKKERLAGALEEQNAALGRLAASGQEEKKERSHEGMKLITAALTGLTVVEENNTVTVSTESMRNAVDLTVQVPYASTVSLRVPMGGTIAVENVSGEIEVNGGMGSVTLRNVSGSAVVHTMNGDIEATFSKIAPDKPLSFSTMNGDIDVTLPADVKADLKLKSQMGNIYSDFDVSLKQTPEKIENAGGGTKGEYRISFDKSIYGTINGGGQEITFNTFHGDIFLRKKK